MNKNTKYNYRLHMSLLKLKILTISIGYGVTPRFTLQTYPVPGQKDNSKQQTQRRTQVLLCKYNSFFIAEMSNFEFSHSIFVPLWSK